MKVVTLGLLELKLHCNYKVNIEAMSEKTDYVMLPPKNGSGPRKPLTRYLILGFLLVAVAAVSWWFGQRSTTQNANKNAEIKQVPTGSEHESDPQLAGAIASNPAGGTAAIPAPAPDPAELAKGGITIATTPAVAVAEIEIINMDVAEEKRSSPTPATLTELPIGFYDMKITAKGYKTHTGTFEVVADKVRDLAPIDLVRSHGNLDILTTQPAAWELHTLVADGSAAKPELAGSGESPGKVSDLPTDAYQLTLKRDGWPEVQRSISILEDKTTEIIHDYPEGGLSATSLPDGVEVWMKSPTQKEATLAGKTPLNLKNLPEGDYQVVLKPSEGDEKASKVKIEVAKVAKVHGSWQKLPVQITSDPPGATIFLGSGRLMGEGNFSETPMTVLLLEGEYDLLGTNPGLKDLKLTIKVAGDRNNNVANFPFEHGSVKITSEPSGAEVYVGQQLLGTTPMLAKNLKPDDYQFKLRKERYGDRTVNDFVRNGRQTDINVKLNYDPMPTVGQDFTNSVGQRMKWVPAIKGWVETTETSQFSYSAVMDNNPSLIKGDRLPVNNVSWNDAKKYCERLSLDDGAQGLIPAGYAYRIPMDAEWTIIADKTTLEQSVTSNESPRETIAQIASLEPNALGLYDTRGNVWEWCLDWYTREVADREQTENASSKPSQIGSRFKIMRGGSWNRSLKSNLSVGFRLLADPGNHRNYETGFRVILVRAKN
ncbi:MAG: hypothetical protein ACI8UO_003087 [Verrucomicrobiales bacterium]|jgi:hypothetical protein